MSTEQSRRPRLLRREIRPVVPHQRRSAPIAAAAEEPNVARVTHDQSSDLGFQVSHAADHSSSSAEDESQEWVIEVCEGVYQPLRLSEETEIAWSMGRCVETFCFVCEIRLACINDCDGVVCPECLNISPIEQQASMPDSARRGGVGLGIQLG